MIRTLSIYYSGDRVYAALFEASGKGLSLEYINSTEEPVELDNIESAKSKAGIAQLKDILEDVPDDINGISISVDAEYSLASIFPGDKNLEKSRIKKLINLEMRHIYPQYDNKYFATSAIPLAKSGAEPAMMLSVILPNEIYINAKKFSQKGNAPFNRIEVAQLNAVNSFVYNYPELADETTAIFGIGKSFSDVIVIDKKQPAYINLLRASQDTITEPLVAEINKIMEKFSGNLKNVYFFGTGLNKTILSQASEALKEKGLAAEKINAFRLLKTSLGEREVMYCIRTAQIFPPCVGAALPNYHDRIKIS